MFINAKKGASIIMWTLILNYKAMEFVEAKKIN